jgi:branched-chain amino acid transport system ATP-binding protein
MALLELREVTKFFGGLAAVKNLTLDVNEGAITAMIGPNGAGKSTAFNLITGIYRPTAGTMTFDGHLLNGLKPNAVTAAGIARTFQTIRLFAYMTVLENVMVGHHARIRSLPWGNALHLPGERREERATIDLARELLEWVGIARFAHEWARNLPYGMQKRLEIARALAAQPKLLLLDEPAAGTNPAEKQQLMALVRAVRDRGVTVLLIEHDMKLVMGISDFVHVLDYGEEIARGKPEEIRHNPRVIEAYLGKGA